MSDRGHVDVASGFLSSALADAAASAGGDKERDRHSSSRHHEDDRHRSSRRDDYDDRRSSRRYEDDGRSSRHHDDDRRRDRERDSRSSRYEDMPPPSRSRGYEDDRRSSRYDDRGPPRGGYGDDRGGGGYGRRGGYGGGQDDFRGGGGRGYGGGGGGGPRGRGRDAATFGQPERRSPTPEGTIPISKRKRARTAWDVHAPGYENINAEVARMTGRFNLPGQTRAPSYGGPSSGTTAGGIMPPIHYTASEVAPQLLMARQSRRLYVGNITLDANDSNIAKFFNGKMREMKFAVDKRPDGKPVQSPDPVVSIQINHDKSYAFVEFRTPEEANSAMAFDGIVFQGQVLKIRRPKDYIGPDQMNPLSYVPGIVHTAVPDSEHKIFVGGLPSYLNEDQVKELLNSFGELKSFNLVKDSTTGGSKGYAFCEYADTSVTDQACAGLNGMELGDRFLVVQRASVGAREGVTNPGAISGTASGAIMAAAAAEMQPSRGIQLLNMVTPEDLTTDEDYEEIKADILEECSTFGQVVDIKMARPILMENGKVDVRASERIKDLAKVFIVYTDIPSAQKAMEALAGRQFAGRTTIVAFLPEEAM